MRKAITVGALTAASMLGGAAVGAVINQVGSAGASDSAADTTDSSTTTVAPAPDANGTITVEDPDTWMQDALKPLVDDGTITQDQADAVIDALRSARPEPQFGHLEMGIGPFGRLDVAADAIGVDLDTLLQELPDAGSLADVARNHDVDPQKVIDALVADAKSHLAEEVKEGHLTQAQADEMSADITDRVTAMVNGDFPVPPDGAPFFHHFELAPGGGGSTDSSSSSDTTGTGASFGI